VTETIAFGPLQIEFDDRVLRPRPWTAAQSHWAAELLADVPDGPVLELCSGAGQIGLLAVHGSSRRLVCVDLNPVACDFARANAAAAGMQDQVEVREGRAAQVLRDDERFPLVIADPPWVPTAGTSRFPEDPLLAIDGGDTGLDVARECVATIEQHLLPGGRAVLQLGTTDQAQEVSRWLADGLSVTRVETFGERGVLVQLERVSDG
jgi:release factor glutamine methyltransferase